MTAVVRAVVLISDDGEARRREIGTVAADSRHGLAIGSTAMVAEPCEPILRRSCATASRRKAIVHAQQERLT